MITISCVSFINSTGFHFCKNRKSIDLWVSLKNTNLSKFTPKIQENENIFDPKTDFLEVPLCKIIVSVLKI